MRGWAGTLAAATIAALATVAGHAAGQENPPSKSNGAGFGDTQSGIFAVENVFGFTETTISASQDGHTQSQSFDDKGFFPGLFGPRISLHGVSNNVTYGVAFGMWYGKPVGEGSDDSSSVFVMSLSPRIGYAGTLPKQSLIGYWVRTGPTVIWVHGEDYSSSKNAGYFAWGIDAFGVIAPVPHFAVFFGPTFDIAIYGQDSDNDEKIGIVGIASGLLADW